MYTETFEIKNKLALNPKMSYQRLSIKKIHPLHLTQTNESKKK